MPIPRLTSTLLAAALLAAAAVLLLLATSTARAAYGGWTISSGPDPVATIEDLEASSDAFAPGRSGGASGVELTFRSTVAQHLRITVLDVDGRELRTIVDADIQAGPATWAWDGRDAAGALVADGTYELVVEAGSRADSMSISDVVRVDRRAPVVTPASLRVRMPNLHATSVALPIVASEAALVDVSVSGVAGRGRTTSAQPRGRSAITVPLARRAALRSALGRSGRARLRVGIVATDDAGNRSARTVNVDLLPPIAPGGGGGTSGGDEPGPQDPPPTSSRLSWPLSGPLTSRYGMRWGRMHNGIDVGVPTGRAIGAAAPGRVTYAGWMSGYGNTVIVDHGQVETLSAHMSRISTRVGANVTHGQTIGLVGSTGNSTGPHLHFEVRVNGAARDPLRYLP